jgi:DNA-binding NarL/FixJ family response regulator
VLAEDQALLRDGLVRLLTAHGFDVVAAVETGPDLLTALLHERPDVAVADIRLPPTFKNEGLVASLEARRQVPGLPVLILSQHVEPLYARELLSDSAGAIGYLLKDRVSNVRSFVEAVWTVAAGGTTMDPDVITQLFARRSRDERLGAQNPRQREVLAAMAEGHANAGIAARLVITEKAVSNHINTIFAKLGLLPDLDGNRRVLAVLAFRDAA